jgi:hypothetical protein
MVRTLQKSTFDYFGKLLSSEPALKWQLIVKVETVDVGYVSLTGTKSENAKRKEFSTLSPCFFQIC